MTPKELCLTLNEDQALTACMSVFAGVSLGFYSGGQCGFSAGHF